MYTKFILAGKKKYIELCCLVSLEIHDHPTQVVFKPPTNHSRVSCFAQSPGLLGDYFKHLLSLLIPLSCSSAGDLAFTKKAESIQRDSPHVPSMSFNLPASVPISFAFPPVSMNEASPLSPETNPSNDLLVPHPL